MYYNISTLARNKVMTTDFFIKPIINEE